MKYKVVIDSMAKRDLGEIFEYVSLNDSFEDANKLLDSIEDSLSSLEEFPERGHLPNELRGLGIKKYLEIFYKPYRILYEIRDKIVYIHSVLDGRRNINDILSNRILR
ncbi:MAG: type II toxin-antitoxin system RelE/ParE family toxin [Ignavibacteriaceae bacterium]